MKSSKFTSTPLFPRQALVALLLPLIAEQALSVTIGLADTLMVSSVGEAAVSGVSLVDSFNTLMIQIMSALATGGAVVTSQYIGHQEPKNAKAAAAQILFVLSSFSVLVAAVVIGGRHAILRGIFGSIDADVMHYAETYFLLSALSYPFIYKDNAHLTGFNVGNQPFPVWTLKIRTAPTVVRINRYIRKISFTGIAREHILLRRDLSRYVFVKECAIRIDKQPSLTGCGAASSGR